MTGTLFNIPLAKIGTPVQHEMVFDDASVNFRRAGLPLMSVTVICL
jgi:hypothetical protein